ncbi:SRPBCC family protein [Natronoglycomyces albus]|uniref:SRPBCC domain-containing protein n=1 Tax=Natronoglycomyces albus TaxID=2811108 RepID=A0A895XN01_9ACTN|nr:SRPBCC domain-containing protein [Natronoglycomyces albus]QSB04903.1 SRPBCC domain-containing protein [Natronoglycomyces albus]
MTVTSVEKDLDSCTLTVTAEFTAPIEKVWELWANPRKLEKWWGPPTYPATVTEHDFSPGGDVAYHMTGPEGDKIPGRWRITEVDRPTSLEFVDSFADQEGQEVESLPQSATRVNFEEHNGVTYMQMVSSYDTREQLEQIVAMGAMEGIKQAMGQMDALLDE